MLIICGLMCVMKDVRQCELPRYIPPHPTAFQTILLTLDFLSKDLVMKNISISSDLNCLLFVENLNLSKSNGTLHREWLKQSSGVTSSLCSLLPVGIWVYEGRP